CGELEARPRLRTPVNGQFPANDMLPSEAIRVLEHAPSRVVILDPPYYSFGVYLLVLALCSAGAAYALLSRSLIPPLAWMLVLLAVALSAFESYLLTSHRRLILSRAD